MDRRFLVVCALFGVMLAGGCKELEAGGGTGGTGGAGGMGGVGGMGGTGGAPACTSAAECPDTECRIGGSCNAGQCQWGVVNMPGEPVGEQVYGDCKRRECSADGDISQVDDMSDRYDFGNPCYRDECNAWMTLTPDTGAQCTTKWFKAGTCRSDFNCIDCMQDVDCGGTSKCTAIGKCVPAHCANMALDIGNNETDVDCGGPCAPCNVGLKCSVRPDCEGEGACVGNPKVCQPPTCDDGQRSGDETGPDCGGACVQDGKPCPQGQGCLVPADCASGLSCISGTCQT